MMPSVALTVHSLQLLGLSGSLSLYLPFYLTQRNECLPNYDFIMTEAVVDSAVPVESLYLNAHDHYDRWAAMLKMKAPTRCSAAFLQEAQLSLTGRGPRDAQCRWKYCQMYENRVLKGLQ